MGSELLEDTRAFLDLVVERHDPVKLIFVPFTITAAFGSIGLITDKRMLAIFAGLSTFVVAAIIIAYQSIVLRETRQLLARHERVIKRYIREIRAAAPKSYTEVEWDEIISIGRRGDAVIDRWITLQAGEDGLNFYMPSYFKPDDLVLSARERSRVRVSVHGFSEDRDLGARYDVITGWRGNYHTALIPFDQGLLPNEIVRVFLRWTWPGYYRGLLEGEPDVFEWSKHGSGPIALLKATIIFGASCRLNNRILITPYRHSPSPAKQVQPDGSVIVRAEYTGLSRGDCVGFRVDITRRNG